MKLTQLMERDVPDVISVDVPLFIRLLEWSREEAKEDVPLHLLAEKAIELSKNGPLAMRDYEDLMSSVTP